MATALSPGSVLVVGVGSALGTGAAIARCFARAGHTVVIAGRNEAKLSATLAELHAARAHAVMAVGDAAVADDARRFVATAEGLAPLAVPLRTASAPWLPPPFPGVQPRSP